MTAAIQRADPPGNILVVDDTPANLKLLTGVLSRDGHTVRPAPSGRLALSGARSRPPDLILLDINMPEMSGFDVMEALKADPGMADIPVVMVTVQDDIEAKEAAFSLGAVDYITKPFNRKEVRLRVRNHLALRRHRARLQEWNQQLEAEIAQRERLAREKELLAGHLRQAHKMEALGTLVGGIAHNFNNILSIIIGHAELAKDDLAPGAPAAACLAEVEAAAARGRDEVQRLLQFSRGIDEQRRPLPPAPVIRDALQTIRSNLPENIRVETDIPDDLPAVEGEPIRLRQALAHLFQNAVEAMAETGGTLSVRVSLSGEMDDESDRVECRLPGAYLRIDVADTGHGISPAARDRLFDPYFTTRGLANHAGMGLSIVHGIIRGHDGRITHQSRPGGGALFRVLLPTAPEFPAVPVRPASATPAGTESILLVEGDDMVARMLARILERLGYQASAYTDPDAALSDFRDDPDAFDLAVLDADLPLRDGGAVSRELRALRPEFPLVHCTRYGHSGAADCGADPRSRQLEKPADRRVLARAVRDVLDGVAENENGG